MQRIIELCTKLRSSLKTKISRLILEAMATTREEVIMVEEDTTIKVDTTDKVNIRATLQEGQDVGSITKRIISAQIVLTRIEST